MQKQYESFLFKINNIEYSYKLGEPVLKIKENAITQSKIPTPYICEFSGGIISNSEIDRLKLKYDNKAPILTIVENSLLKSVNCISNKTYYFILIENTQIYNLYLRNINKEVYLIFYKDTATIKNLFTEQGVKVYVSFSDDILKEVENYSELISRYIHNIYLGEKSEIYNLALYMKKIKKE